MWISRYTNFVQIHNKAHWGWRKKYSQYERKSMKKLQKIQIFQKRPLKIFKKLKTLKSWRNAPCIWSYIRSKCQFYIKNLILNALNLLKFNLFWFFFLSYWEYIFSSTSVCFIVNLNEVGVPWKKLIYFSWNAIQNVKITI